jgi:hypothetical protein
MIFEVVAALKLANDAISTIKTSMGHVHSIKDLAKPLTQLADAKEAIKERADKGDLDAFVELKQIQDQEEALKRMMIWELNRGDLWTEYQTFLKTRKTLRDNERRRAELKKKKRREDIKNTIIVICGVIAVLSLVGAFIMMLQWFMKGN